jgi:hypothetical protein
MKVIFSIIINMVMENILLGMEILILGNTIKTKNKVLADYKIDLVKSFMKVNGKMEFLLKMMRVNLKEYTLQKRLE